jgi:hypothetical protein
MCQALEFLYSLWRTKCSVQVAPSEMQRVMWILLTDDKHQAWLCLWSTVLVSNETKRVTVQVWRIWDSGTGTSVGNRDYKAQMTPRHVWHLDYCYLRYGGVGQNRTAVCLSFWGFHGSEFHSCGLKRKEWYILTAADSSWWQLILNIALPVETHLGFAVSENLKIQRQDTEREDEIIADWQHTELCLLNS